MLHWAPPTQFQTLSNVFTTISINPRITHYMVYVTESDLSTNSDIVIRSRHRNFTFPCVYTVQVSAVNSAGEGERSSTTTINSWVRIVIIVERVRSLSMLTYGTLKSLFTVTNTIILFYQLTIYVQIVLRMTIQLIKVGKLLWRNQITIIVIKPSMFTIKK
jgi:hypothetical protein